MIHADRVENKAGRPCHDCQRLTWCMRQLCPWCDKKRREKAEAERAAELMAEQSQADKTGKVWRRPSQDLHGDWARREVDKKMRDEEAWFGSRESYRVEHADTDVGDE